MDKSTIFSWIAGIVTFIALNQILPEVRCADGWSSLSIGRQGACSHHGGVKENGIYILLILGVSIWAGISVSNKFTNNLSNSSNRHSENSHTYIESDIYSNEVSLITSAIKQRKMIEFLYQKSKTKSKETRRIKPIELNRISHSYGPDNTLCIKGLCEKRKANRNFALKRMTNLKAI